MLIVTILIQTHGKVINLNLDSQTSDIFQNVRLLCKASGFENRYMNFIDESILYYNLSNIFKKDIETSTKEIIDDTEAGIIIGNITYDKSLSRLISGASLMDEYSFVTALQGIYLLSIHDDRKLIYPTNMNEPVVNLMKLDDIFRLSTFFNTRNNVDNFFLSNKSQKFPDQPFYINKEKKIKSDKKLSNEEKQNQIKSIRTEYYTELNNWNLTIVNKSISNYFKPNLYIDPIRLSKLVELVKIIIGQLCFINLLDYSCNSQTIYMPEEDRTLSKYVIPYDEEQGIKNIMTSGGQNNCKSKAIKSKAIKSKAIKSKSKARKSKNKAINRKSRKSKKYII